MRFDLIAFYGGPDQVMTVTSGIASVIGVLLIFWHKLVGAVIKLFRRTSPSVPTPPEPPQNPS